MHRTKYITHLIVYVLIDFSCKISYIPFVIIKIIELSGEDGRSRAEQQVHMLIDQYVYWPVENQRRVCHAVHVMLILFQTVCISGYRLPIICFVHCLLLFYFLFINSGQLCSAKCQVVKHCHVCSTFVQVVFKFCFWAFIESMGSFMGSKGLHFFFGVLLLVFTRSIHFLNFRFVIKTIPWY